MTQLRRRHNLNAELTTFLAEARQTDRQKGRQAGRQAGRQVGKQAGRQAGRQAGKGMIPLLGSIYIKTPLFIIKTCG